MSAEDVAICPECLTAFEADLGRSFKFNQAPDKKVDADEADVDFDELNFVTAKVLATEDKPSTDDKVTTLAEDNESVIEQEVTIMERELPVIGEEINVSSPESDYEPQEVAAKKAKVEAAVEVPTDHHSNMKDAFNQEPRYLAPDTYKPLENELDLGITQEIMSTINCPHCGNENPNYYSFCHFCKHRLHDYMDEEQLTGTAETQEVSREEAVLAAKNFAEPIPVRDPQTEKPKEEMVLSHVEVAPPLVAAKDSHKRDKRKGEKKSKRSKKSAQSDEGFFKWVVRLLVAAILIALAVLAYLYFRPANKPEAVYTSYRQAIINQDYVKAAELTANSTGPDWQANDVEKMLANYEEANIDFLGLLSNQAEGTMLASDSTPLIEVETDPSFLGLMNQYEVIVEPIKIALTVPNNYRDIKLTTFAHADQPITAGDPIIVEPRETEIIVSLHDGTEERYIALNLDYSQLANGTLPISLKQVNNEIQIDEAASGIQYPNQFNTTGFEIDGERYTSNLLTLNGYVSQSFTVSIIGEYFGTEVQSQPVEVRLVDTEAVLVDLSSDENLVSTLAQIEANNADNIQPSDDTEQFDQWVAQFQQDYIDAINFRAPNLLVGYGESSQWYQDTTQWIQNEVATSSIFYTEGTYEITNVEPSGDGNVSVSTFERYYYTLDGIEAIRLLNRTYHLQSIEGQYIISAVDEQDAAN